MQLKKGTNRAVHIAIVLGLLIYGGGAGFSPVVSAQSWSEFRGPGGQGHSDASDLPLDWADAIAWKTALPGRGWSSPVVVDNQIWLTTAVETPLEPAEASRRAAQGPIPGLAPVARVTLLAVCVDATTGQITHQTSLTTVDDPPMIHSLNSYASPTPVVVGGHVVCHFGTFGTWCLNRNDGKVVWENREHHIDHETGPGSSPIAHEGLIIFHMDGTDSQYVVGLDQTSGSTVWKTKRSGKLNASPSMQKAFATPTIVPTRSGPVLISPGADWLYGYDPADGTELWKVPYGKTGFSTVPRPVVDGHRLFICTGFMRSSLLAMELDPADRAVAPRVQWQYDRQVPTMPTPLFHDGLIYMVSDQGIATCVDADERLAVWQKRLGGAFSASPIFADGFVWFSNRDGEVIVVAAGNDFEEAARHRLDSPIMGTPAAVGSALFVRTAKYLYRIQKPAKP